MNLREKKRNKLSNNDLQPLGVIGISRRAIKAVAWIDSRVMPILNQDTKKHICSDNLLEI
jgi:hypothetical protein